MGISFGKKTMLKENESPIKINSLQNQKKDKIISRKKIIKLYYPDCLSQSKNEMSEHDNNDLENVSKNNFVFGKLEWV